MGKFCPFIGILAGIVNGLRNEFSMRNAIASQLVRHNLSRFAMVIFQQSLEEARSSRIVTTCLEQHFDHLAILVNSAPQVLPLATDLHRYFVDVECFAESLMPTFQPFGILRAEFIAPQTNRFIAYGNTAVSHTIFNVSMAEIELILLATPLLAGINKKPPRSRS